MFQIVHRVADRIRPWAAPAPPADAAEIVVIGAGPAGLATAALLRRAGVAAVALDRSDRIGSSWAARYDSLRLNTVRWMSDLPGLRMSRPLGRWVGRDDLVGYLERYAEHHRLEVVLGARGAVDTVEPRAGGGWSVTGGEGRDVAGVVVATGHSRRPSWPDWPDREAFRGRLLHTTDYRRPSEHAGAHVLVVGAGSSGGEICVDLARAGIDVVWSVRSTPQILPREVAHLPTTPFGPPADVLPDAIVDRLAPWIERRVHGPRDYLPDPTATMTTLLARCKEPMTADGIVELIRRGRIQVVDAVDDLDGDGATLVDGTHVTADVVIAATGYRTDLEHLVGGLGVLDDGHPIATTPLPGLGFVGFRIPLTGTLWAIEHDARRVANRLAGGMPPTAAST